MKSIHILAIAFAGMFPLATHAVLLTDASVVPADAPSIDFAQFAQVGRTNILIGDPPLEIDAIQDESVLLRPVSGSSNVATISGDHTPPVHPDNNFYLGRNGHWGPGRDGFLGVSDGGGQRVVARIEFASGPVAFVGGLFNYSPNDPQFLPLIMTALDSNLSIIEQHVIDVEAPISTAFQTDVGAFRGIVREQNEIFAIEISAVFTVIDDIRFVRVVPEPIAFNLSAVAILMAIPKHRANRYRLR